MVRFFLRVDGRRALRHAEGFDYRMFALEAGRFYRLIPMMGGHAPDDVDRRGMRVEKGM